MASEHETDVPMTLITGLHRTETASGYIRQPVPIRIITAFIQLFCSTKFPDTCPSSTNSVAPKNCPYAFKLQNWWWKRLTPRVIPVDGPWNIFFNGIVGHVRDRQGNQVDGWHQATQLANYWPRHFGVHEDSHPYHDYNPMTGLNQPPVPITQLAWLLHSILSQDPAGNDSILSALSRAFPVSPDAPPLSSDSLNHEGQATWRSW